MRRIPSVAVLFGALLLFAAVSAAVSAAAFTAVSRKPELTKRPPFEPVVTQSILATKFCGPLAESSASVPQWTLSSAVAVRDCPLASFAVSLIL
jgi:hypothetical protein